MFWYPKMIILYLLLMGGTETPTPNYSDDTESQVTMDTGDDDDDEENPPIPPSNL